MTQVIAPNLGMSGMDITIEKWFKSVGEKVEIGDPLFEIASEKLTQDIDSPETGVLTKIYVQEGEKAEVDAVLAEIE